MGKARLEYMKHKVIILSPKDNVAVALMDLPSDSELDLKIAEKKVHIRLIDSIPYQHKFSLKNIRAGSKIIKDSVVIGESNCDIKQGQHVHIHNMTGLRSKSVNL